MTRRRPIFGWIAFGFLVLAVIAAVGSIVWGYLQTQDAFVPGPPWFMVAASTGTIPVAALGVLALLLGIVGTARREKPGWPAITAMILALPALGAAGVAAWLLATVTVACAGPAGACF